MMGFERVINSMLDNPALFVLNLIILLIAIALHEWGHAVMATLCGDPTPKYDGRVTLNPLAHLDPIGTFAIIFMSFGWGKPVMVQPANFRNKRWDHVKVAAAGPAMNLFQALVFGLTLQMLTRSGTISWESYAALLLYSATVVNLGLMAFNLIPIGPLDGATILKGLLPLRAAYEYQQFNSSWGMLVAILLLVSGSAGMFIRPVRDGILAMIGLPVF